MNTYYFMHENKKLAVFTVYTRHIKELELGKNSKLFLPVGIDTETKLIKWIEDRLVPVGRTDFSAKKIDPFPYMMENKGVSLTDHYWVQPIENTVSYEQINPYTNDFDKGNDPTCTLGGSLTKKYYIAPNGERRILKANVAMLSIQSLSEVLATEIHKRQNKFAFVPYQIEDKGKLLCSCPIFTNIETEFVPAIDIVRYVKVPNNLSLYECYLEECKKLGLDVRKFMEYQIMTDFVITNTDRHLNNFGLIKNSKTQNFVSYAPIFDSGNSMFFDDYVPTGKKLLSVSVSSFCKKEVKLMSYVKNKDLVDISLLPSDEEVYQLLKKDRNALDGDNEKRVRAYKTKIKFLEDFQNGAKIWSYNYLKG